MSILGKIKKPNFGANFFKFFSLEHHKKNEWKIRVGKPFRDSDMTDTIMYSPIRERERKKLKIVWPRHG